VPSRQRAPPAREEMLSRRRKRAAESAPPPCQRPLPRALDLARRRPTRARPACAREGEGGGARDRAPYPLLRRATPSVRRHPPSPPVESKMFPQKI
jgi:hypothetical protein